MKTVLRLFVTFFPVFFLFLSCTDAYTQESVQEVPSDEAGEEDGENVQDEDDQNQNNDDDTQMDMKITITAGGKTFAATLEDNQAGKTFASMLPMTLQMNELNGNEKYHYLDESLPTASTRVGTIHAGDLMLYGSSCVVLFYETFSSGYSYTRLGRIDHPDGLADALGSGNVTVTFSPEE